MDRSKYYSTRKTEQDIANRALDEEFNLPITEPAGYDGKNMQRLAAPNMSIKITEVGSVTYIAQAAPGTGQEEAKWQVKKVDETEGLTITWADGNADFDNVATDLTALTYS